MCENCETKRDIVAAEMHFQNFLISLGLDMKDPNLVNTAHRVTKMYSEELFAGLTAKPPAATFFDLGAAGIAATSEMIISGPLPVKSLCSHHFMPIEGSAWIGVLTDRKEFLGLSKYARIVEHYARRPQIQEALTQQIMNHIVNLMRDKHGSVGKSTSSFDENDADYNYDEDWDASNPELEEVAGVIVVIKAKHFCMSHRGVNATDSVMTTSSIFGKFHKPAVRSEFFALAKI